MKKIFKYNANADSILRTNEGQLITVLFMLDSHDSYNQRLAIILSSCGPESLVQVTEASYVHKCHCALEVVGSSSIFLLLL
jgi:hypothetical protein